MPISDEYDIIIIGKTPAGLMTSINLSNQGYKVLILNNDNFNNYPDYIVSPLSSLKAMNIPYDNNNSEFISMKTKNNYIERVFEISRFQIAKSQPTDSEMNSNPVNPKIFFDKRELVCVNIKNFINYLTTISTKMNVEIQKISSYNILSSKDQNRVSIVTDSGQNIVIKSRMCNIITTSPKNNQAYIHQTIFIPKILTDGLDVFFSHNIFPSAYVFILPSKSGSVINFIGKNNSDDVIDRELIQIMDSVYGYNIENDIKNKKKYSIQILNQNQPIYSNDMFCVGSSLSIAHPITFGYFSGELQTGLAFTDAFFDSITHSQKFDLNKVKSEYLKRLSELSFISELNNNAGREFYKLNLKELESLMNLLHFTDLSYVSVLQKLKFRLKIQLDRNLRKKKKLLKMIYKSYSISRKWY
ncbi:MAG: hypothetical protein HeimC3_11790 [Candidatus Heimdallarchaeota archaeon LC_3]|nr:MAG: hypothetical protein HeimC3_11790 [Candidatus Heimdallarchaeota archaeon LC_3]